MEDFDPEGIFAAAAAPSVTATPTARTYITKRGNTATVPGKPKGTLTHRTRKAIKLVVDHGVEPKDAYNLVHNKEPSAAAVSILKAHCSEYSLHTVEMQRLAGSVVKNALKGKPLKTSRLIIDKATGRPVMREDDPTQPLEYIEKVYPSHTNMLAAASMVQDRVDPIVRQNINLNGNLADYLPFELDRYK